MYLDTAFPLDTFLEGYNIPAKCSNILTFFTNNSFPMKSNHGHFKWLLHLPKSLSAGCTKKERFPFLSLFPPQDLINRYTAGDKLLPYSSPHHHEAFHQDRHSESVFWWKRSPLPLHPILACPSICPALVICFPSTRWGLVMRWPPSRGIFQQDPAAQNTAAHTNTFQSLDGPDTHTVSPLPLTSLYTLCVSLQSLTSTPFVCACSCWDLLFVL